MVRNVVFVMCLLAWCATAAGQARDQSEAHKAAAAERSPEADSAIFGSGHLRFVQAGKPYTIPVMELKDPRTGRQILNPSRYSKRKDARGDAFHHSVLAFTQPGAEEATISLLLPGPGEHWAGSLGGRFELHVLMRGVLTYLNGSHFPGCTLSIAKLDAAGVEGKLNCPQRPPADFSEIEFSASP